MCAMSPRLLRPRATGFNPKSISGLALWLDGADSSYNATTGTWSDKSGGGRNATQSTAASRPTVGTLNGKPALVFDGSNDHLLLGNIASAFPSAATVFVVCNHNSVSPETSWATFSTGASSWDIYNGAVSYAGVFRSPRVNALRSIIPYQGAAYQGSSFIIRYRSSSSAYGQFVNGGVSFTAAPAYNAGPVSATGYVVGGDITGGSLNGPFKGTMCEVLAYSRELTDSECARVEDWLAAKWGASFGPSVSNADARDWIRRVYLNNGTVSASTASAVNTFCNAIDAEGIRDRFYRLNLFCGTGLSACLVPLYRGQSRTGTQYGNATDTNNGPFVSGDYAETGASGGLTSNGTSKYLNTGFKADTLGQTDRHLSMVGVTTSTTTSKYFVGMDNFGCGSNAFWGIMTGGTDATQYMIRAQAAAANSTSFSAAGGYVVASGNGSAAAYADGVSAVTGPAGAYTAPNLDIYTHALNRCGTSVDYTAARLRSYSIGAAMTASQVTSFYNALLAFNTALSRA